MSRIVDPAGRESSRASLGGQMLVAIEELVGVMTNDRAAYPSLTLERKFNPEKLTSEGRPVRQ